MHLVKTSERHTGSVVVGWAGQLWNLYEAEMFS